MAAVADAGMNLDQVDGLASFADDRNKRCSWPPIWACPSCATPP